MSSSFQDQLQRVLGDAYVLERELGGGGMSRVFVALERSLGRRVVVKVMLPELSAGVNADRFRREIQLAAMLQHPHIVPLLAAGEADGLLYLIMPFVTGESLRARVTREGEFPVAETVRILRDVVSALAYAHSNGVVHRDVKPDNVLLSGGVAVVTDFGVAKAVSDSATAGGSEGLTSIGVALGTPAYMAPEQATANPATDHRADIYALGVMAYEMLTGNPPFFGRSAQQVLAAHVVEEPEPVERRRPAIPPLLAALVKQCLAKRPADRPQTAVEVMHALDAIATPTGGTAATTAVRLTPPAQVERARRWPLQASIAAVLVMLGAGAIWLGRGPSGPEATPSASVPERAGAETSPGASTPAVPQAPPTPTAPASPPPTPSGGAAVGPKRTRRAEPQPTPAPPAAAARESAVSQPAPELPRPQIESVPTPAAAPPPLVLPPLPRAETVPPSVQPPPAAVAKQPPKPVDPAPGIRSIVAEYAAAIESKSLADLQRVYPGMTPIQQRGWEQFFQLVRDVKAQLSVARLDVSGSTAEAQVTGTYIYLNTSTGRPENQPVSFQASFRREGDRWRMREVR